MEGDVEDVGVAVEGLLGAVAMVNVLHRTEAGRDGGGGEGQRDAATQARLLPVAEFKIFRAAAVYEGGVIVTHCSATHSLGLSALITHIKTQMNVREVNGDNVI